LYAFAYNSEPFLDICAVVSAQPLIKLTKQRKTGYHQKPVTSNNKNIITYIITVMNFMKD
jgi:hypothetical protein